jgi:hypothetical protein
MDLIKQLLSMDRDAIRARLLAEDPQALRELRALVAVGDGERGAALMGGSGGKRPRTPLPAPPQGSSAAVDSVFGQRGLFEHILSYAVAVAPDSRARSDVAPLLKLSEVSRQWRELSRVPLSIWLPVLKAHAPPGAADCGALVARWPGGPGGYVKDYMRCLVDVAGKGTDRFWRPEMVMGVEVRDVVDGYILFAAAGGLEMWPRKDGYIVHAVMTMQAGKAVETYSPAFALAERKHENEKGPSVDYRDTNQYFGGVIHGKFKQLFEIRVTVACKATGRIALLLDTKEAFFQPVEDRTRDGDMLLVLTTKNSMFLQPAPSSTPFKVRMEFRFLSAEVAADAKERKWVAEPGGVRLTVESATVETLTAFIWSHML